jgi:hypothetical protein
VRRARWPVGFSSEMAGGGGVEKTARRGGVLRWRRSSGAWGGRRRVLQHDEGAVELTEGGDGPTV